MNRKCSYIAQFISMYIYRYFTDSDFRGFEESPHPESSPQVVKLKNLCSLTRTEIKKISESEESLEELTEFASKLIQLFFEGYSDIINRYLGISQNVENNYYDHQSFFSDHVEKEKPYLVLDKVICVAKDGTKYEEFVTHLSTEKIIELGPICLQKVREFILDNPGNYSRRMVNVEAKYWPAQSEKEYNELSGTKVVRRQDPVYILVNNFKPDGMYFVKQLSKREFDRLTYRDALHDLISSLDDEYSEDLDMLDTTLII